MKHSPFYHQLYQEVKAPLTDLSSLPVTTKSELMEHFDGWVTDPAVTRTGVENFLLDKSRIGCPFLGSYSVWKTSGTTGFPGIFMHDRQAQAVYRNLVLTRAYPSWVTARQLMTIVLRGFRYVFLITTGDHFAGVSNWEQIRQSAGRFKSLLRTFSVLAPLPETVQKLNAFQPAVLASYPSALALLAREQVEGRLRIHPVVLVTASEWLEPAIQDQIEEAFNPARLFDIYGASEFPYIAFQCRRRWLHLNADWLVLEPVDVHYQPVAPGQPSHTVLLTNLANCVQPIIRYDLGDRVMLKPDPCPCGSLLPAIRVEGRKDDVLSFQTPGGKQVQLLPMAVETVIETTAGVGRYQLIQTGPSEVKIRLEVAPGKEAPLVW
ncbi:MAG: phenylacetate--CoA ligase family protein [Omnitrophica WOR_2 bacterium]